MLKSFVVVIALLSTLQGVSQLLPVNFPSLDGVIITGEYLPGEDASAPIIILCHQARFSRGEYREIGMKLREMGYASLAIDLRSGDEINGVKNKTHLAAVSQNKPTTYLNAEQDILAAIDYTRKTFPKKNTIYLWGSSYSASLAIKIGAENEHIDAVIAFSPGEYFIDLGKSDHFIKDAAKKLYKPSFVTAGKDEIHISSPIFEAIAADNKVEFIPRGNGQHGSKNLWEIFDDHEEYWEAVANFLSSI